MIKNCYNFNDFENDDFWLHRYSSANHLESMFKSGNLNLRFSTALNFEDPLEGWGFSDDGLKSAMDIIVSLHNRVSKEGGVTENFRGTLKTLGGFTNSKMDDLEKVIQQLSEYNKNRNSTYISCWFKTSTLEEENRAMWKLFVKDEDGIRISVKWSDLKKQLQTRKENFNIGFIDYGNKNKIEDLFFIKDKSYKHEKEFRITLSQENTENYLYLDCNELSKVYCTVRSKHNDISINTRLGKLNFNREPESKLVKTKSNLSFESKQVDWRQVLKLMSK